MKIRDKGEDVVVNMMFVRWLGKSLYFFLKV